MKKKKIKKKIYDDFNLLYSKRPKFKSCIIEHITDFYFFIKTNRFNLNLNKSFNNFIKDNNYNNNSPIKPSEFSIYFNNKLCRPFWNDKLNIISKTIFLPYQFSDKNKNIIKDELLETNFNKNKWFNSSFYNESNPDLRLYDIEYKPKNKNKEIVRTQKIKLYFNFQQREVINNFMSGYRYLYNRAISYFQNLKNNNSFYLVNPKDENSKILLNNIEKPYSYYNMRYILLENLPDWLNNFNMNSHLKRQAIEEAFETFNKCMNKYKLKKREFNLNFKTKKDIQHTINIEKIMISTKQILFENYKIDNKKVFTENNIREDLSKYNYCDSSITYNKILNKYFLNLVYKKETEKCNNNNVCSIDPGVRNFVSLYSDNKIANIGINCNEKINKLNKELDIIKSRLNKKEYIGNNGQIYKNTKKRKRQLRKAQERKQVKLSNIIKELHNQTSNYLTKNYSLIINTPFESQKMVQTLGRNTSRIMNNMSYYKFKQQLKGKCEERNVKMEIKEEYYTSKTCTYCGHIKRDLGNDKTYECNKCKIKLERDSNGARNILLRNYESIKGIKFVCKKSKMGVTPIKCENLI